MALAARGTRQLGERVERITDEAELAQVRRQARRVYLRAFAAAVVLTLLTLLIP